MLVPVGLQHAAFRLPGIYQDGRGVVVGSVALLLLPSRDRLISALRLLSEEPTLSDLLPDLQVEELRSAIAARGYLLRLRSSDSRTLDRCARIASLCFAGLYVGAERHFIAYRSRQAPLGYDVDQLSTEPGDYILYGASSVQPYRRLGELPLLPLLARLPLLLQPGGTLAALRRPSAKGPAAEAHEDAELWLLTPLGLASRILRLLWERGVAAAAALPDSLPSPDQPAMRRPATSDATALLRLPWSPAVSAQLKLLLEAAGLLALGVGGLRVLRPLGDHLAVELGYAHPLRLLPFGELFDRRQRHLFLAQPATDQTLLSLPASPFVTAERLIVLSYPSPAPVPATESEVQRPPLRTAAFAPGTAPLRLPLRLQAEPTPRAIPTAALVAWAQLRQLGRLIGLLPPTLFADLRVVTFDDGVLLISESGAVSSLPIGRLFYPLAPAVLVPLGMALLPRLRGQLLRAQLSAPSDHYFVFLPDGTPFSFAASLLTPLSAQLVGRIEASPRAASELPPISPEPLVENDPVGRGWPLWGRR